VRVFEIPISDRYVTDSLDRHVTDILQICDIYLSPIGEFGKGIY
jgi:hypothetical protein